MAKVGKKYYAVRKGHKVGIFNSWAECKAQVDGFSGAEYKGFATLDEANAFMGISVNKAKASKSEAVAYVDGSFDIKTHAYSYGVVMFYNENEEHFKKRFDEDELASMRNVAGEIKGAEFAMQFCVDRHIKSLDIYYDYEGIEKWCTGVWKATKDGTMAYQDFFKSINDKLQVNFIKVAGHSGDKYNDLADMLAKSALGLV